MTVARSVGDVLTEHVRFQVERIDRVFLNVYVPQLQYPAGLVGYVHRRLGLPIASTAPLAKIADALSAGLHRLPIVPYLVRSDPAIGSRRQRQFRAACSMGEMSAGADRATLAGVDRLHGIGRADDSAISTS